MAGVLSSRILQGIEKIYIIRARTNTWPYKASRYHAGIRFATRTLFAVPQHPAWHRTLVGQKWS